MISEGYVIVLRGPCGGGKTSIAKEICGRRPEFHHIELDSIKEQISGSTSCDDGLQEAAIWFSVANQQVRNLLLEGKHVILDEAFADPYLLSIALMGIRKEQVVIVEIVFKDDEHIKRYLTKENRVHKTPDVIKYHIERYRLGGYGNTPYKHIDPIVNDFSLNDSSKSAGEAAEEIIKYLTASKKKQR